MSTIKTTRLKPKVRVRRMSPNRGTGRVGVSRPSIIVVHSTEGGNVRGLSDLVNLGGWFANPSADVSSHVAIDDEGNSARFVRDGDTAWAQAAFNRFALSIEHVGRASQKSWTPAQRLESARWIAYWSKLHGIPIQKGKVSGSRVIRPGVLRHSDLGAAGGNHHDPGRGFDLHDVLVDARLLRRRY